jgi:rubrerythrin
MATATPIVLDPMFDLGGTSAAAPATRPDPRRTLTGEHLAVPFEGTGLNGPFIADVLSAMLTHERCGAHLYRSVSERTLNPMLKRKYKEFGAETEEHVAILTQLIASTGGDPNYVSPLARGVEKADTATLQSTFMLAGSLDPMQQESIMLDAVLIAESVCHSNWATLAMMVDDLPAGPIREAVEMAVGQVGPHEDEHLQWAKDTKTQMIRAQAKSSMMANMGKGVEAVTAAVRDMFSSMPGT